MQISQNPSLSLHDYHPRPADMRTEILDGLRATPKNLPCKYFYDTRGSRLFDAICELPEYYLTRVELSIMEARATDMAAVLGPDVLLVEPGSGSSLKTRLLLDNLAGNCAYVPVDIAREHLLAAAARMNQLYPELEVLPVCADFSQHFILPVPRFRPARTVVYFPGSTIGNFEPVAAVDLLIRLRKLAGRKGGLLIGVDLQKNTKILERAYNDSAGVTAAFNLNLLQRLNRDLGCDFDLNQFQHRASYNPTEGRIEIHLVSLEDQSVQVADKVFNFQKNEYIVTEYSYKHTLSGFAALATRAGLNVQRVWTDDRRWFSVQYLEATGNGESSA